MKITANAIIPKNGLKDIHIATAIAQAQRNLTAPDVLKLFNDTIEGWSHRPNFSSKQTVNTRRISMKVGLIGTFGGSNKAYNIYNLVNSGSPPHLITPRRRRGGFLRFQKGYIAATIPGQLMSHAPKRFGEWWSAGAVDHPGFPGRNFPDAIIEEYQSTFFEDMQNAINEAVRER